MVFKSAERNRAPGRTTIHANYPTRCVGVSEYGAGASIYQHSENPTFPANTATSFHPEEWQNIVMKPTGN